MVSIFHRAFRRAGFKLVYSQGFHPLPKMSFAVALPVGIESLAEVMDVEIYGDYDEKDIPGKINPQLPAGLRVLLCKKLPLNAKLTPPSAQKFVIACNGIKIDIKKVEAFQNKSEFKCQVLRKGKVRQIDIKKLVKEFALRDDHKLEMTLALTKEGGIKITEALMAILGLEKEQIHRLQILKVGVIP